MKVFRSLPLACAILLQMVVMFALAGCSMPQASDFKPSKLFSLGDDDEPEKGTPVRMVGTWTDTVLTKPGQVPQRGFGGRLVFYGKKEEKPILVDGQLVVYAFDETGREVTDNRPTRRYVFPPDQIPLHMSKSEIGASYSFWLPWDEAGGPQTEVSLICRFEPKGGAVITSEQTKHVLPGTMVPAGKVADGKPPKLPEGVPSRPAQPTLESVQQSRTVDRHVQLASHETVAPMGAPAAATVDATSIEPQQRMATTTIPLPSHYQFPVPAPVPQAAAPAGGHSTPAAQPRTQPQQQAVPMQSPQPAVMSTPAAATALPAQPAAQPMRPGFGVFPAQHSFGPTGSMPTMHPPAIAGFGTLPTMQQPMPNQPLATQLAAAGRSRTTTWNTVQTAPPTPGPASLPQQVITQPASQPLPPPTGVTTTVNYSPAGAALR
jgi:hypothetical protein